jgi:hypothetical protein
MEGTSGDQSPLVDVGIPTFGTPPYLAEAIESVFAQTFTRWRLTISDNGGGKVRETIAAYLNDSRVTYRMNTDSSAGGLSAAAGNWSALVEMASAPYVALLHDDDRWDAGFLASRVAFLAAHPECGLVYGPHVEINASGREIQRAPIVFREGVHTPERYVGRFVRDSTARPSPPSLLVTREAYRKAGARFDPRFVVFDTEMWLRISIRFPVGYLTTHDSYYRLHGSQLSARTSWGEAWIAWQEHMEHLLERDLPSAAFTAAESRARRASALLSSAMDAAAQRHRQEALRYVRRAIRSDLRSLVDPRVALTIVAIAFGGVGVRALRQVREIAARKVITTRFVRPH